MRLPHVLALTFAQVLWGANFAVLKFGLADWPPLFFVSLRLIAVGLLLTPFVGLPKRTQLPGLIAICGVLGIIHFGALFASLDLADAATTSIVIQIQVPIAALVAAWLFGETLHWRRWTGMALALAGIALLVGRPSFQGGLPAIFLILVAAVSWVAANIQIKKLEGEISGWQLNAWVGLFSAPMVLALSLLTESGHVEAIRHARPGAWIAMAYQVGVVTVVCYGLWYSMMRRYPIGQVMPFTLLEPVFGATAAVLLLHETWDWVMVLGGLVTVSGLAIIILRRPEAVVQPVGPGT